MKPAKPTEENFQHLTHLYSYMIDIWYNSYAKYTRLLKFFLLKFSSSFFC
jgi:hypothetical protein